MTIKEAKKIIENYKNETAYFDESLTINSIYRVLRDSGFGIAESKVIVAALVVAGAKLEL